MSDQPTNSDSQEGEVSDPMERLITLPDHEEIIRRLTAVAKESDLIQRFYYPYAQQHAGREFLPQGVILSITLAAHDYAANYLPVMGALTQMMIPNWVAALIDDPEVAQAAKNWFETVENKVREERKAATPPRVEPEEPVENWDLFLAMRRIAEIFFEEVRNVQEGGGHLNARFSDDGVNPYYSQTHSGLFVEYYYGHPSKLWTPWGYWDFVRDVSYSGNVWETIIDRFLARVGAVEYMPLRHERYGDVGPVYALHRVDDQELPEPVVRERQNYLEYEVANNAWKSMVQRYKSELQAAGVAVLEFSDEEEDD